MKQIAELCFSINTRLAAIDPTSSTDEEVRPLAEDTEVLLVALNEMESSELDLHSPDTIQTAFSTIVTLLQLYVQDAEVFQSVVTGVWKCYGNLIRKYAYILDEQCCEDLHVIFTMSCADGLNHILHCTDDDEMVGALKILAILAQRLAITLGLLRSVPNPRVRIDAYAVLVGVYGFLRLHDNASGRISTLQQNFLQSVKKVLRPFAAASNSDSSPSSTAIQENAHDHISVLDLSLLFSSFETVVVSLASCGFAPVVLVGTTQVLLDSLPSPSIPDTEKDKAVKYILRAVALLSLCFQSQFHSLCLRDVQLLGMNVLQLAALSPSRLDSLIVNACGLSGSQSDHTLSLALAATARTLLVSAIMNSSSDNNAELLHYCIRAVVMLFNRSLSNEKSSRSYLENATELIVCLLHHPPNQYNILNIIAVTIQEVADGCRKRKFDSDKIILPWSLLEYVLKNLPLLLLLNSEEQQVQNDVKHMIRQACDDLQGSVLSYERQAASYCLVANITSTTANHNLEGMNIIMNPYLNEIVRLFVSNKEISMKTLQLMRTLTAQLELYAKDERLLIVNVKKITSWAEQITTLVMTFFAHQLPKGVQKVIAECMSRSSTCLKAIMNMPGANRDVSFQSAALMLAILVVITFDLLSRTTIDSGCEQEIAFALKAFAEAKSLSSSSSLSTAINQWQAVDISLVELAHRSDWAHRQIVAHIGYAEMQQMMNTKEAIDNKQRLHFSAEEIQENLFEKIV